MRYSIKISVWKTDDTYGKPDEIKMVGDYYTMKAALADIEELELRLIYAGYNKFTLGIIENEHTSNV